MCDVINANQEDREQLAEELKQSLESALKIQRLALKENTFENITTATETKISLRESNL